MHPLLQFTKRPAVWMALLSFAIVTARGETVKDLEITFVSTDPLHLMA